MEHCKKEKVYKFGERFSFTETRSGQPQDHEALLERCLQRGSLFQDPEFPCTDATVWGTQDPRFNVVWKRPQEIIDNPEFITEGFSRFDINQGSLGNCWMVASIATLTLHPELMENVIPAKQSFAEGEYAGIFHFRFWKFNRWIDVPVDDRLPVNERNGSLAFMTSSTDGEFWSALLEKAYAKLHGGYAALEGGTGAEAFTAFTGGISEQLFLRNHSEDFFGILQSTLDRKSLATCCLLDEKKEDNGLIGLHEYSVTAATKVLVEGDMEVNLIRLRNPWGRGEWTGLWSDSCDQWDMICEETRLELGLVARDDGEFWISEPCFLKHFDMVDICHLDPGSMVAEAEDTEEKKHWEAVKFEGSWVPGCNSAGRTADKEKFATNPQYFVTLPDPGDEDEDAECTMIVALHQRGRRFFTETADMWLPIGFTVCKVEDPDSCRVPLTAEYLADHNVVFATKQYRASHEVTGRLRLSPGTYCIVPHTYREDLEGDFLLRIYTEKKSSCWEHDEEVAICGGMPCEGGAGYWEEEERAHDEAENEVVGNVREAFDLVASEDGTVDYYSLQTLINNLTQESGDALHVSLDMCRGMTALMDSNYSGKLSVQEFNTLYELIIKWQEAFYAHDEDSSGELSTYELRKALRSAGYSVNQHVLKALILRYGHDRKISLSDFIGCVVKLMCMIDIYNDLVPDDQNAVVLSRNEWLKYTMYC